MKQSLIDAGGSYAFSAATRTIVFGGVELSLSRLLAVINVTRDAVIYNPTNPATGGIFTSGVLTLNYDTTGHANSDQLIIFVDLPSPRPASNQWAQALSVTAGATATIIAMLSSPVGYQVRGMVAHGNGDGYFFLQLGGVTILSGRIRSTLPTLALNLPNSVSIPTGSTVALKVTNESGSTANYEATLLGA